LRTIAATTWAEYKRYFEKDAALERRFQPVKVDEPDDATVIAMLRGLRDTFEKAHGVVIRDEAIVDAVKLSSRYISGRQMPDKAIDLLDMTAARVKTSHNARPEALVAIESELAALGRAEAALVRDVGEDAKGLLEVRASIATSTTARDALLRRWEHEREGSDVTRVDGVARLVHREVDREAVAQAVSAWTGIPLGNMRTSSLETALTLESTLSTRIMGQHDAVAAVSDAMRLAASGIRAPNAPQAVLLFVGPTGVGKTETSLALADLLYGGERFMTTINMTEFQEKHSVSRLIGSPPGYVGYGEGGLLTEAVRQRPHSIVLLDECEKADLEVMNLFYQVFDRGMLSDSEGRVVDFRNTVLVLTSNLGSDTLMRMHESAGDAPSAEKLIEAIRPELARHFKPALLARMTIVPFRPISDEALQGIARARLRGIAERVKAAHDIEATFDEGVIARLITHANHRHSGARGVDHALRTALLPSLSRTLLERAASRIHGGSVRVVAGDDGAFAVV
jgi:type VI secretion system protein VasG